MANICIKTDSLVLYLWGTNRLVDVYRGIYRLMVLRCHCPKWIFDNNGSVATYPQLQKHDFLVMVTA